MRIALLISIALNVLLIGAIGGAYFAGARLQRPPEQQALVDRLPGPRAFIQALPQEQRQAMRERFRSTWEQTRALREEARDARVAAFEAASQEPFDTARVRAAFERLRAADQAAIGAYQNTVIEAFAEMNPEERSAALEALRRAPPARRDGVQPAPTEGRPGARDGAFAPCEGSAEEIRQCRQERRARRRERLQDKAPPPPQ